MVRACAAMSFLNYVDLLSRDLYNVLFVFYSYAHSLGHVLMLTLFTIINGIKWY